MQKLFTLAALAAATQALSLKQSDVDFAEVTANPTIEVVDDTHENRPNKAARKGKNESEQRQSHSKMAQRQRLAESTPALDFAEQYTFQCSDVFDRVLPSANPDVPALIAAGTQFTDSTFTQEIANFQNRQGNPPFERISEKFPTSAGW